MDYEWVWWGVTVGLLGHVLYQVHQLRADVRWLSHRLGTWYGKGMYKYPIYYAKDAERDDYIKWSGR